MCTFYGLTVSGQSALHSGAKEKTHPKPTHLIEKMSESNKKLMTHIFEQGCTCLYRLTCRIKFDPEFIWYNEKVRAIQLSGCTQLIRYSCQTLKKILEREDLYLYVARRTFTNLFLGVNSLNLLRAVPDLNQLSLESTYL